MPINSAIKSVHCRRIWDSRGKPTVEVDVILEDDSIGRGIAPAGASRGAAEASEIRDGGKKLGGLGVSSALNNINSKISPAMIGMDTTSQREIDSKLVELDPSPTKDKLGGNATIAVSLATLNANAEKDSLSSNFLSNSSFELGLVPFIEPMSIGLGKKSTTASNNG